MNSFRKKVDLFIAVSEATKNKILEKTKYDSNKIEILYNFVDLNKFKKIEIENNKY
ncbi:MAG: glycosyltransferase family 4 protein [bacterium]|nr:glycosyltransferase family 4 protein [bacterium]MDP3380953.1 glycosyltransferase family 4 protein [bacterium]